MSDNERDRAEIRPVKRRVEDELISRPGVVGVDIGEKVTGGRPTGRQAIVVYVQKKKPRDEVPADELIPDEIDGVPTDVVEEEIVLHVASSRRLVGELPQVDGSTYPTLTGGISIGPCRSVHLEPPDVPEPGDYVFVGTLGALVRDRSSGGAMALTNFHVACVDSTWSVGDTMTQPSRVDNGSCPAGTFGKLTRAVLSENVDGAVITLDAGKPFNGEVHEVGAVAGHTAATVGMAVRKRGRTTELTHGTVVSVDATVNIDYGDGLGPRTLRDQIRIDAAAPSQQFGDHGDSGSVVVTDDNKVVGLHFAGNSAGTAGFANPIQAVLDELDVDLLVPSAQVLSLVTRPVVCDVLVTQPAVCELTRPVVCMITRPVICQVTRTLLCDVVTRAASCTPLTRSGCPPITRACGGAAPPSPEASAEVLSDAYWSGYLAALEAAAEASADHDGGS